MTNRKAYNRRIVDWTASRENDTRRKTQKGAPRMAQKSTAKAAAKPAVAVAAPAVSGAKRVFGPNQCHLRAADGTPACQNERQPGRNLCRDHEKVWQAAAKIRRAERLAGAATTTPLTPNTKVANAKAVAPTTPGGNGVSRPPKAPHPMKVLSVPTQRVTSPAAEASAEA